MTDTTKYPLVTIVLFSYNQEKFIQEAVESLMLQDYPLLEIILSDDCSSDSTFDIMNSLVIDYRGPHKIVLNRNKVNLGLAKHFSKLVKDARGEIVVVAAGDDISLPIRVSRTVEILRLEPEAYFVSFSDTVINEKGEVCKRPQNKRRSNIKKITLENYLSGCTPKLSGASRGYRKKVFEVFGELDINCPTEDTPSILRCLMMGHGLVSSDCGILYRQHGMNLSGPARLKTMKIAEIKKQYLNDASLANSRRIITNSEHENIKNWVERDFRRRSISINLYGSSKKLSYFLLKVLFSNEYSFREKFSLLLSSFRSRR